MTRGLRAGGRPLARPWMGSPLTFDTIRWLQRWYHFPHPPCLRQGCARRSCIRRSQNFCAARCWQEWAAWRQRTTCHLSLLFCWSVAHRPVILQARCGCLSPISRRGRFHMPDMRSVASLCIQVFATTGQLSTLCSTRLGALIRSSRAPPRNFSSQQCWVCRQGHIVRLPG